MQAGLYHLLLFQPKNNLMKNQLLKLVEAFLGNLIELAIKAISMTSSLCVQIGCSDKKLSIT
jgi:hypothetical protein